MPFVLTNEKFKEFLEPGTDVAVHVLSLVKDAPEAFPPLRSASRRALFIADSVKEFRESKHVWKTFGHYVKEMVGEVVLRYAINQSGSEESFGVWKKNIDQLDGKLTEIATSVDEQTTKRKCRSALRAYMSYRRDSGRTHLMKKMLDVNLHKFELQTNVDAGQSLALVTRRILEFIQVKPLGYDRHANLKQLRIAPRSDYHPSKTCLSGTRTQLIEDIMGWCRSVKHHWEKQVVLLTAVAGAGKSAVAHTIAHRCAEEEILLSSFFFRTGETTSPEHLFSSIARSLAIKRESYCTILTTILEDTPSIATTTFDEQFRKLVLEPLRRRPPPEDIPLIIVIDALDECDEGASVILAKLLRDEISELPRTIKFLITSRHTRAVDYLLNNSSSIHPLSIRLSDGGNLRDCDVYIRSQISELKKLRPMADWPSDLQQRLSRHARGLFVWVSTTMDYVKNKSVNPVAALEDLLEEGAPRDDVPMEENLDALYTAILRKCNWRDRTFKHNFPIVMGAIVAAKSPLSAKAWGALLSPLLYRTTSIEEIISELRPLFTGADERSTPIQLLHQSFRDYLRWRIAPNILAIWGPAVDQEQLAVGQEQLALCCFQVINTEVRKIAGLGVIERLGERDVMPTISDGDISEPLAYACRFALDHTLEVKEGSEALKAEIKKFLDRSIIDWLEFCIRAERYISVLSFFDWIEIECHNSRMILIKKRIALFLGKTSKYLGFICRFTEALDTAIDAVWLVRSLVDEDPASYTPHLADQLSNLGTAFSKLNRHTESLGVDQISVRLYRSLVAENPGRYTPDLACQLANLGADLSNLNRHTESLKVRQESVGLYRSLVAENPGPYTPDLARQLGNLGADLSDLNQHPESLKVCQESIGLYRSLVAENSASFTPDLARQLGNLGVGLSNLNQHTESLTVHQESVSLYRSLVAENPASYTPNLAFQLGNLGIELSNLNRHAESLKVRQESVGLYRSLVVENPASYTPDLAFQLGNMGADLSNLNRHTKSLKVRQESVSLYRSLVAENPASFTPGLAHQLGNLGIGLSNLNRHTESLKVRQESVGLYRSLAAENPASYTPDLACQLGNLGIDLSNLSQHAESLKVRQESVGLYRSLVAENSASYTPNLAFQLGNLGIDISNLNRHAESLMVHQESVELYRSLVVENPASYTPHLARRLHDLSIILSYMGRHAESQAASQESARLSIVIWRMEPIC